MAWGSGATAATQAPGSVNLGSIMSEQMAESLEGQSLPPPPLAQVPGGAALSQEEQDFALALKLSLQESGAGTGRFVSAVPGRAGDEQDAEPEHPAAAPGSPAAAQASGGDASDDFALALQLQEEEDAALLAFSRSNLQGKVKLRSRFEDPRSAVLGAAQQVEKRLYSADDAEEVLNETRQASQAMKAALAASKAAQERLPPWPVRKKNLRGQGGTDEIVTKHDAAADGERNWAQLGDRLCEGARTGDVITSKHKITNRVYNALKHSLKKQEGLVKGLSATVEREAIQTHAKGLDQKTRLILHRMVNAGLLEAVNGVVRTGKEALVYHAQGHFDNQAAADSADAEAEDDSGESPGLSGEDSVVLVENDDGEKEAEEAEVAEGGQQSAEGLAARREVEEDGFVVVGGETEEAAGQVAVARRRPRQRLESEHVVVREFAVKVFKTTLTEFKNRLEYVRGDHRFRDIERLSRQNPRKVVAVWVDKEMRNLMRARRAGIPCPYPVRIYQNVLVMEFIGEEGWPAPQLREANLSRRRLDMCYLQTIFIMHALATRCNLVHADLSEYNLLYMKGRCFMIDMGQSVLFNHPQAEHFLRLDCTNITRFFASRNVSNLIPADRLVSLLQQAVRAEQRERWANPSAEAQPALLGLNSTVAYAKELGAYASQAFAELIHAEREQLSPASSTSA